MNRLIGFIGAGTMGRPMVMNLMKAGFAVTVYNRTRPRLEPLLAAGAEEAESPEEAARGADFVVTMLSDSPVVREAVLGESGALKGTGPGATIIDMSTISPAVAAEIAEECAKAGVAFLDAPVTGGESGAVAGTLSILVGGDTQTLETARPVLEAVGSRITHFGGPGAGQAAKLCNQVVCGLNILAACEGMALCSASGLDPRRLLDAITGGAAGSWMLSNLPPKMIEEDWSPGFRIRLQQKDLRLALEAAQAADLPLPGTALVSQLFRAAEANGSGEEGTQALYKVLRMLGALEER